MNKHKHSGFCGKMLLLAGILIPIGAFAATGYESVSSDQPEYMPDDTATITGVGFEPNQLIEVQVIRADGSIVTGNGTDTPGSDTVTADATGHFDYSYLLSGADTSVYNGTLTVNAIDPNSGTGNTLATTTFIDGDTFVLQGCNKHVTGNCSVSQNASPGWAGGSNPLTGWTSGELGDWHALDSVPFRARLNLKNVSAGAIDITTMQDNTTTVDGATVLGIDSASNFYVGVGPGGTGSEGDLAKSCVFGSGPATEAVPCVVSGPTYSSGDPQEIQYAWSVYFDSSEVGDDHSQWALYWTAHLSDDVDTFVGPNGKISTSSSQTENHHVYVNLHIDGDHDGVSDDDDHCPGTPSGEYVNHHHGDDHEGCGYSDYDYDGDGVKNRLDLCPGTPEGETVDENGCSAEQRGEQQQYTLTIISSGTGSGSVSGAGTYSDGTVVTVTATANPGSVLSWDGTDADECASGFVTMDADKSCTAVFTAETAADLVITDFTVSPTPAIPGQAVTFTATISNNGGATATNFDVDLYQNLASAPGIGQAGDVTCNVGSLAGGESTQCSGTVTYSALGFYSAWVQADTQDVVSESDESNNNLRHDLAATGVSTAVCDANDPIATSIDPSAVKSASAVVGAGTTILASAVLGAGSSTGLCSFISVSGSLARYSGIGNYSVMLTSSTTGYYATLGDHSTLGEYAALGRSASIGTVTYIGYNASVGANATVGNNVTLANYAITGVGASIGDGSYLGIDSEVGQSTSLGAGSYISDNSIVGKYSMIGSQLFVGTNTLIGGYDTIGDNVTIGNNQVIGGTTSIGAQSTIGNNGLIGSYVQIGVNVTIGNNVTIGGQATVCDNAVVPDGVTVPVGEVYGCN